MGVKVTITSKERTQSWTKQRKANMDSRSPSARMSVGLCHFRFFFFFPFWGGAGGGVVVVGCCVGVGRADEGFRIGHTLDPLGWAAPCEKKVWIERQTANNQVLPPPPPTEAGL